MNIPQSGQEMFDDGEAQPPEEMAALQLRALNRVLRRAAELPFYQRPFADARDMPARVGSFEEYACRVPRIRKADIVGVSRANGDARVGIEALGRHAVSNVVMTSGTLGFNTFAFLSRADLAGGSLVNSLRELWSVRVRPGMRVLTLSPAWHALALLDTRGISAIGAELIIPWGTFAPRFVPNFVEAVRLHRPEHILLTAPVLRGMIDECDRRDLDLHEVFASVRYVACAGESLSPSYRRYVIERLGLNDLYERGGSSDGMFGGGECFAHRGHHISADLHYVEVVDPRSGALLPPGRRGTSVVTNLRAGRSVYVRFDTEDVAEIVPGQCPCGRTDPVLELYGRCSDSVVLEDRIVAPADIRSVLDTFPALMSQPFSVEHVGEAALRVKLGVVREGVILQRGAEALRNALGIDVALTVDESLAVGWKGQAMRGPRP
jgi:phenylacetate-CoA ligase